MVGLRELALARAAPRAVAGRKPEAEFQDPSFPASASRHPRAAKHGTYLSIIKRIVDQIG